MDTDLTKLMEMSRGVLGKTEGVPDVHAKASVYTGALEAEEDGE